MLHTAETLKSSKIEAQGANQIYSGSEYCDQGDGGLVVNILAQRDGSVGSSPSQERLVIMDNVEKQLKWVIVSLTEEIWDGNQEASHHLLAEFERTCTWLTYPWPWRTSWETEKERKQITSQPENGWFSELRKDWFCAIDNLLCSF